MVSPLPEIKKLPPKSKPAGFLDHGSDDFPSNPGVRGEVPWLGVFQKDLKASCGCPATEKRNRWLITKEILHPLKEPRI
jgi:hypothetical protein